MHPITQIRKVLLPREKWLFLLMTAGMFFAALLELIGIGSILPVIAAVIDPERLMKNEYVVRIMNYFPELNESRFIILLCAGTGFFFIVKNALLYLLTHCHIKYSYGVSARAAKDLLQKYLTAPWKMHQERNSLEFLELIQQTRFVFAEMLNAVMMLSCETLTIGIIFLAMFVFYPLLTLAVIIFLLFFSICIYLPVRRLLTRSGDRAYDSNQDLSKFLLHAMECIREVKLSGRLRFFKETGFTRIDQVMEIFRKLFLYSQLPRFLIESLTIVCGMGLIVLMLLLGQRSTEIVMGVSFFGIAMVRLMPSVSRIHYNLARQKGLSGEFSLICKDLEKVLPEKITDDSNAPALTLEKEIRIENVSFAFGSKKILNNVSFSVKANTSLALAGPTGCGKSTMLDMLAGLNAPEAGRITADGRDIRENMTSWRSMIGIVPQTIHISDADVWENVAFGIPRSRIDRDRVLECLKEAMALDFARKLERGLDTVLGQDGCRISGGQRQRIGIARALYPKPKVLLFDEATSALDPETERALLEALSKLNGKYTLITAAHKETVLRNCDAILRFNNGNLI